MYIPRTIVEASRLMPTDRSDKNDKKKEKANKCTSNYPGTRKSTIGW